MGAASRLATFDGLRRPTTETNKGVGRPVVAAQLSRGMPLDEEP
jgi:hypothetical protein